mgnify:CR=1 FL=1
MWASGSMSADATDLLGSGSMSAVSTDLFGSGSTSAVSTGLLGRTIAPLKAGDGAQGLASVD